MWKVLVKEVNLGEPTSFLDHVYFGCTMRPEINSNDFGGFLELTSRFEFEFRRRENYIFGTIRIFGVFKVQSHTMWPYMCLCCGLFVPTQFRFECCDFRDDS